MKYYFPIIALFIICNYSCEPKFHQTKLAFGSCSHEFDTLQMWNNIIAQNPSLWIWMGDNIYGDTEDMDVMKAKYDLQKYRPSYQKLMQSMDIYGIWDDHDYGVNDGGRQYPKRKESKELMLDFLDVPSNAEVRKREGAYQSHWIENNGLSIKLILLDTRYFRDSLEINLDRPPLYHPNLTGTILGEEQWLWLENELTESKADIHLIGSSYQLIPNDHGYEKWGNFPNERDRFFRLIAKTKPMRPVILSGDRHIAEISRYEMNELSDPIYEFTSSGLTHTWGKVREEANQFRVGELTIQKNFGIIQIDHLENDIRMKLIIYGSNNEVLSQVNAVF